MIYAAVKKAWRGRWLKSGVTQDKSPCARWAQIASGDGGCSRVISLPAASRSYREIARHNCVYRRLAFVHTMSDMWHHALKKPNTHRRIRGAQGFVR